MIRSFCIYSDSGSANAGTEGLSVPRTRPKSGRAWLQVRNCRACAHADTRALTRECGVHALPRGPAALAQAGAGGVAAQRWGHGRRPGTSPGASGPLILFSQHLKGLPSQQYAHPPPYRQDASHYFYMAHFMLLSHTPHLTGHASPHRRRPFDPTTSAGWQ